MGKKKRALWLTSMKDPDNQMLCSPNLVFGTYFNLLQFTNLNRIAVHIHKQIILLIRFEGWKRSNNDRSNSSDSPLEGFWKGYRMYTVAITSVGMLTARISSQQVQVLTIAEIVLNTESDSSQTVQLRAVLRFGCFWPSERLGTASEENVKHLAI